MHKKDTKRVAFLFLVLFSLIYSLPNFYKKSPAIVIIPKTIESAVDYKTKIKNTNLVINKSGQIVFKSIENQMAGYKIVNELFDSNDYYKNLTLIPTHPKWLDYFHAESAPLGLDLMGGVYFLMDVDVDSAIDKSMESLNNNIQDKYKNKLITLNGNKIIISDGKNIEKEVRNKYLDIFNVKILNNDLILKLRDDYILKTSNYAVKQNILILKNRVNEIGVSEPIVQREGVNRIIIQLPGIQDTQKARDLIGTTASLEFKQVKENGILDKYSEKIKDSRHVDYVFYKKIVIDGKSIIDANSGIDPQSGSSVVSVRLSGGGGDKMLEFTSKNIGKLMGTVLTETTYNTLKNSKGKKITTKTISKRVINIAKIQGAFSNQFQITGLDDKDEAHNLAILLRSGSLAAPINIIEERTIGPNLGAKNIENGTKSILVGLILVLLIMGIRYKWLGVVANFCVIINVLLLLSVLSIIGATLTLPGLAGMLLTVGMSIDGNVIIIERIKEEYKKTKDVQDSIKKGYDNAFSSIFDANVTSFIAAFILYIFGSGAVKGFAITLSIGIVTSLISSVYLSRVIVEYFWQNKKTIDLKEIKSMRIEENKKTGIFL